MFTREATKAVKGLAVIMMLLHHLACFPERYAKDFEGFASLWKPFVEQGYLIRLAGAARLCVALFLFLGGYGVYKRWHRDKFRLTESMIALYKSYWKVFVIFIPIAFIFFHREGDDYPWLCQRFVIKDNNAFVSLILSNFLGLADSLNGEWWFFTAYLCVMPMGLLFCMATRNTKSFAVDLFLAFIIDILIRDIFPGISSMEWFSGLGNNFYFSRFLRPGSATSAFYAGIVFAKHGKLEEFKGRLTRYRFSGLLGLIGCLGVLYVRSFILGELIEIIHAAAFTIFASIFFDSLKPLKKGIAFVGKYSTDMWLIHSFFCYYFYEFTKMVYATRSVWADLLILIALSLISSILLELFYSKLALLKPICDKYLLKPQTSEIKKVQ